MYSLEDKVPQLVVVAMEFILTDLGALVLVTLKDVQNLTRVNELLNPVTGHTPSLSVAVLKRVYHQKVVICEN